MKRIPKNTVEYLRERFTKNPISYKTAFVIVVLIHIIAYGGLVLLNKYKADRKKVIIAEGLQGPYSDALKESWPTDNLKLQVKAKPTPKASPSIKPVTESIKQTIKVVAKPTPKSATQYVTIIAPTPAPPTIKPIEEPRRVIVVSVPSPTPTVRSVPATAPLFTLQNIPIVVKHIENTFKPAESKKVSSVSPEVDRKIKEITRDVTNFVASQTEYTIQPGENLYMIAHKMQTSFRAIMIANNIRDPRDLRVGQTLKIPRRHGI